MIKLRRGELIYSVCVRTPNDNMNDDELMGYKARTSYVLRNLNYHIGFGRMGQIRCLPLEVDLILSFGAACTKAGDSALQAPCDGFNSHGFHHFIES